MALRILEVPEDIWKELKPCDMNWGNDVEEVTQKFWDEIPEERRLRIRELKKKIWEYLKQRDNEFREFEEARITDFLHYQKRRGDRKNFQRYVRDWGSHLTMKYSRIILVEEENFSARYYGLHRETETWERVNITDIIGKRNININNGEKK